MPLGKSARFQVTKNGTLIAQIFERAPKTSLIAVTFLPPFAKLTIQVDVIWRVCIMNHSLKFVFFRYFSTH